MAISASNLVQVFASHFKGYRAGLSFNGVVLDDNATIPSNTPPLAFSSIDEVGEYFGSSSDEYKFAEVYFGGFDNSQVKPATLYFYLLNSSAIAGWLRGASIDVKPPLAQIKAITAGDLTITLMALKKISQV